MEIVIWFEQTILMEIVILLAIVILLGILILKRRENDYRSKTISVGKLKDPENNRDPI